MTDALKVLWGKNRIGTLSLTEKRAFVFQYTDEWLDDPKALPLSIRLPLQKEPFPDEACRIFFANLLPEGAVRSLIARKFGLSESNDFMLLRAIGGECAGAISLLPEGKEPPSGGDYIPLSHSELDGMIEHMAQTPLLVSKTEQRLSLAGAQQKLPVFMRDGALYLPMGGAPSSHIVKPGIPGYENIAANEAFCMRLAKKSGLPVPDVDLQKGRYAVYIIERYDRRKDAEGNLVRIHQEDFCQALGSSHLEKYEAEGGPGFKDCFSLLANHGTDPLVDKPNLLRWAVFNVLTGNCDAHAKNISLLITGDYRLAPFYDLVCTRIYPHLSQKMAMKIGEENRPEWMFKRHWERFAADAGVSFKAVTSACEELGNLVPALCEATARELASDVDTNTLKKIQTYIVSSSRRLLKAIKQEATTSPDPSKD
jgi:serine/threonine-protein kinase HipA